MFKELPYIKDKEGLGYSDVGDTQYPRYLCLDYCDWGDSPKNMWRWQEKRLGENPSVLDEKLWNWEMINVT